MPGARLIGTFQHNSDLNSYLEHVGPTQSNQFAKDFVANRIVTVANPNGGMSAYSVPIDWKNRPIGPGHTVHQVMTDVDGSLKITAIPAPESMTQGGLLHLGGCRRQAGGRVQDAGPRTIRQEEQPSPPRSRRSQRITPRPLPAAPTPGSRPRLRSTPTIPSNRPPS